MTEHSTRQGPASSGDKWSRLREEYRALATEEVAPGMAPLTVDSWSRLPRCELDFDELSPCGHQNAGTAKTGEASGSLARTRPFVTWASTLSLDLDKWDDPLMYDVEYVHDAMASGSDWLLRVLDRAMRSRVRNMIAAEQSAILERIGRAPSVAAASGDLKAVDLSVVPASQVAKTVRALMERGALAAARTLANAGLERHPQSTLLARLVKVLAPARVRTKKSRDQSATRTNMQWLSQNREAHRHRWVALRDGELLDSDERLGPLRQRTAQRDDAMFIWID